MKRKERFGDFPETVFMFSGQGSHYFQMGRALYEGNGTYREWMDRLDCIAKDLCGASVTQALYSEAHGKADPFERTLLTHPAIFMVEYSLAQSLERSGVLPDMVLGVSLGSFAAAAIAGCIGVEDALRAVIQQAIVLEQYCERGGMTAVLAPSTIFAEQFMADHSDLAAANFSSHFVISARRPDLTDIEATLKKRNICYQRLPVSFAFHSRWIDSAKGPFETFMRSISFKAANRSLVCCHEKRTVSSLYDGYFWSVVRHPVRFQEIIEQLEQRGPYRYIDVGPSGTLAAFLRYCLPATTVSTIHSILTPFGRDRENLEAVLADLALHSCR